MNSSEAVDAEILKDLRAGAKMDTSNVKFNNIVGAMVDSTKTMRHESLFRRDVFIDMMLRQIYLAFGKWVAIPTDDVFAEQDGSIRFNTYRTRLQLGVGLDEFKKCIGNIALIYSFKPEANNG